MKPKQGVKLHKFVATGGKPQNYKTTSGVMPKRSAVNKKK